MALNNDSKAEIIKKFKQSSNDCGSSSVQIALLTENINKLSDHFNKNKKDNHSRQGLLKMIMKRRSLMKYLKRKDINTYEKVIKELGLRK
ncbi:MAG: 30S ribosomal protein S15 [Gammaproteobacteria bacterium]|jgi:small subunit ribosomal protein S15|nr:30S ribosomal protein S15 [Gammaproteobacteria bacterium]MBL6818763.1 30S ribosomal protein S15 [Gammaproteobacteria bacterium]MBL6899018.1 30S ribosomal protein S15 [Gammaproteobacteria bacterium]MCH1416031.1 30S ribosomal protein S15 [Gammaproteobacteria bacterium]